MADILVLIPVFNDWPCLNRLIRELDAVVARLEQEVRVVLIDDGSTQPCPDALRSLELERLRSVQILRLRRNVGHQRAIAIGIAFVEATLPCEAVVLMDGDGEDSPQDVPRLLSALQACGEARIIFAGRSRRSESLLFRVCYQAYKLLCYLLTGFSVRVGNFSVIPAAMLHQLVVVSELWNHYAAAVFQARLPFDIVETQRGVRYTGRPSMNFIALVTHGLSAIAVFADRIGARVLTALGAAIVLLFAGLVAVLFVHLNAGGTVAASVLYAAGVAFAVLLQAIIFTFGFAILRLGNRNRLGFLPRRDFQYFVDQFYLLRSQDGQHAVYRD